MIIFKKQGSNPKTDQGERRIVHLKKILDNENFQTLIVILLLVVLVTGFWYGSQVVLNTEIPPALAVVSGSMCIPNNAVCDGWTHPFDRTLHVGDLIIIQGVNPRSINSNYPDSDIIVFQKPDLPTENPSSKIVHRVVGSEETNGKLYFYTKGDGNPLYNWPDQPEPADFWQPNSADPDSTFKGAISEDYVYGKVIMRIPWIGWVAIMMYELGAGGNSILVPLIVIVIIFLIIIEFIVPLLKKQQS